MFKLAQTTQDKLLGMLGLFLICLTLVMAIPQIIHFDNPADNTVTSNKSVELNFNITEANLKEVKFNWNGTNTTIFDENLVLAFNFNNLSALGESDSLVYDISGNGNNGTVIGATPTSDGKYDGGYEFDGVNDYINGGDISSINYSLKNNTVCAWFNPKGLDNTLRTIVADYKDASNKHWQLQANSSGIYYRFLTEGFNRGVGDIVPQLNEWNYICIVMTQDNNNLSFYYNGLLNEIEGIPASVMVGINKRFFIGSSIGTESFWNGSIDEVRIWNKSSTASEIQQRYYSNLKKYDSDKWSLYVNQSGLATNATGINYTYFACAKNHNSYLYFDGVNDYINCGTDQSLNISESITVSIWINTKVQGAGVYRSIINKQVSAYGIGWNLFWDGSSIMKWQVENQSSFGVICTATLSTDTWQHWVGVVDYDNNKTRLYLDGVLKEEKDYNYTIGTNDEYLEIGKGFASSNQFNGSIDEVRIYNISLNQANITEIYNSGRIANSSLVSGGLVGWWKIDDVSGAITLDSSGNSNDGTITGATWKFGENCTETRNIMLTPTYPQIEFVEPTPVDNTITSNTSIEINVSITEANLKEVKFNWNGTNTTIFDDSLVLAFNFNNLSALGENDTHVFDVSGNGNNGIVVGGENITWVSDGKHGGAFNFSGNLGYIDSTDLDIINYTNNWTIGMWIYPKTVTESTYIMSKGGGFKLYIGHVDNQLSFGETITWHTIYTTSSPFSNIDEWYYINVVGEGDNTPLMYVNGEIQTTVGDANTGLNNDNLRIGSYGSNYFNGSIDEVRIWNKSSTASEIQQRYYSNLKKYDSDKWSLYVNQSGLATNATGINYTYFACATDSSDSENCTSTRTITILPVEENVTSNFSSSIKNVRNDFYGAVIDGSYGQYTEDTNNAFENLGLGALRMGMNVEVLYSNTSDDSGVNFTDSISNPISAKIDEVAYQANHGNKIILLITYMPSWLADNSTGYCSSLTKCPPSNFTKFNNIILDFINRVTSDGLYIDSIELEFWNEPDLYGFFIGDVRDWYNSTRFEVYNNFYNKTYHGINPIYPDVPFYGPTLSNLYSPEKLFLSSFFAYNGNITDGISIHQYWSEALADNYYTMLETNMNWIIINCTSYGISNDICSRIRITEGNVWNATIKNTTLYANLYSYQIALAETYLLTSPNNYSFYPFNFAGAYPITGYYPHKFMMYDTTANKYTPLGNTTRSFATYCPAGATVYTSTSTTNDLIAVTCKKGNMHNTIVINKGDEAINLTLNLVNFTESTIYDLETKTAYTVTDNSTNIGSIDQYEIIYLGSDLQSPTISIDSPLNTTYTTNTTYFNLTLDEEGSVCYYSLDGASNISMTKQGVVSQFKSSNTSMTDGSHTIVFYCNDTWDNWRTNNVTFLIDFTSPTISLTLENNTYSNESSNNFTSNLTDNYGLANATIYIYNSVGSLVNETTIQLANAVQYTWGIVIDLIDNVYTWFVTVFDIGGNEFTSENYTLTVDTNPPAVSSYYQWNSTNHTVDFGLWTEGFVSINWNLTDSSGINTSTCQIKVRNKNIATNYTNLSIVEDVIHPDYDTVTGYKNLTCYAEDLGDGTIKVSANMTRSYDWRPLITALDQDVAVHDNSYTNFGAKTTKMIFHNITSTINTTFIFYADIDNQSATVADLLFYSCNSSYTAGDFTASPYCSLVGSVAPGADRDVNFGYLIGALTTDENGMFGGVIHTETMYGMSYCPDCSNTNNAWLTYSTNGYDGHSSTSSNLGSQWTDLSGEEFNVILHAIDNTQLEFNLTIEDNVGNQLSVLQTDTYGALANLAPFGDIQTDNITGSLVSYYDIHGVTESGTVWINITVSDPNADDVNCSIYLLNNDSSVNQTLLANYSIAGFGICPYEWNTTTIPDGDYRLNVTAFDGSLTGYDESAGYIKIDNTKPNLTLIYPTDGLTISGSLGIPINFSASDDYLDTCWYNLINSTGGYEINNFTINCSANLTFDVSLYDTFTLTLYANDSANNLNSSQVNFTIIQPTANLPPSHGSGGGSPKSTFNKTLVCDYAEQFLKEHIIKDGFDYSYDEIVNLTDLINFYSIPNIQISTTELYLKNFENQCNRLNPQYLIEEEPKEVPFVRIRGNASYCSVLMNKSVDVNLLLFKFSYNLDTSIPFFKINLGDMSCNSIAFWRGVIDIQEIDTGYYQMVGIKLWWSIFLVLILAIVKFFRPVKKAIIKKLNEKS